MDLIIIISLLLVAAVVVALVGMYLVFGSVLPSVFAVWSASRDEDLVDTEAEIMPVQERHSSEVLKDRGNGVKTFVPLPITQELSQTPQAAPQIVPAVNVQPAAMQPPPAPPPANVPIAPAVAEAPQELVQRAPILDVQNPIVQPVAPAPPVDVQIPDVVSTVDTSDNKSHSGVRYSSNSSNRSLRDRRHRRNAE